MGEVWGDIFSVLSRGIPWALVGYLVLNQRLSRASLLDEVDRKRKYLNEELTRLSATQAVVNQQIEVMNMRQEELSKREKAVGMMEQIVQEALKSEDDLVAYLDKRDVA